MRVVLDAKVQTLSKADKLLQEYEEVSHPIFGIDTEL